MRQGRVWHLGQDIDTDLLAPGHAMKYGIETIAKHCLENVLPEFTTQVRPGDFIVAGPNFGIGSSREQAAQVLVHLGVAAVIAPSYGGLFFRNAFNVGLLLLTHANANQLHAAQSLTLDVTTLTVQGSCGSTLMCEPIPQFLIDMVQAGGLLPTLQMKRTRERKRNDSSSL
jgi:3-isopropylmalate/(R)-2-methylmalate dehydratase small subunit